MRDIVTSTQLGGSCCRYFRLIAACSILKRVVASLAKCAPAQESAWSAYLLRLRALEKRIRIALLSTSSPTASGRSARRAADCRIIAASAQIEAARIALDGVQEEQRVGWRTTAADAGIPAGTVFCACLELLARLPVIDVSRPIRSQTWQYAVFAARPQPHTTQPATCS